MLVLDKDVVVSNMKKKHTSRWFSTGKQTDVPSIRGVNFLSPDRRGDKIWYSGT
jgi:hypothetical protein